MLKRITYTGKILVPAHKEEPMYIRNRLHEPLISEGQFYRVQQIHSGNRKIR